MRRLRDREQFGVNRLRNSKALRAAYLKELNRRLKARGQKPVSADVGDWQSFLAIVLKFLELLLPILLTI